MRNYTDEEIQQMVTRLANGETQSQVGASYNITGGAISSLLRSRGIKTRETTHIDKDRFIYLRDHEKLKYKDIAEEFGVNINIIKKYARKLIASGEVQSLDNQSKGHHTKLYLSREELLEYVRQYPVFNKCPGSVRSNILREFGKWSVAQKEAGVCGRIGGTFDYSSKMELYLIKTNEVYKIGVTQQGVSRRFSGLQEYTILDVLSESVENCLELERELKLVISSFSLLPTDPWFERGGKTECFIPPRPINSLEEIFDL